MQLQELRGLLKISYYNRILSVILDVNENR